ncbi:helix-turn-helix domain-containing protein [Pseudoroseicyclus aestuarii]|nr:helix-turn-helix domain-containing protein [Pseudoroseicyclus aestuarii]
MEKIAILASHMPLARAEAAVFIALAERRPYFVPMEVLIDNMVSDVSADPNGAIRSSIKRMRKVLPEGMEVECRSCIGYRLKTPEGWEVPWKGMKSYLDQAIA